LPYNALDLRDLLLTGTAGGTVLDFRSGTVLIAGIARDQLSAADFVLG
jgi:hypothetical protein